MKKLIFDFRDYEYKRIELNKLNFIAPEMWAEVELNCFTGYKNTISYTDHTFQNGRQGIPLVLADGWNCQNKV